MRKITSYKKWAGPIINMVFQRFALPNLHHHFPEHLLVTLQQWWIAFLRALIPFLIVSPCFFKNFAMFLKALENQLPTLLHHRRRPLRLRRRRRRLRLRRPNNKASLSTSVSSRSRSKSSISSSSLSSFINAVSFCSKKNKDIALSNKQSKVGLLGYIIIYGALKLRTGF